MIALACVVFGFTYLGLGLGKIPGLRLDRAGITTVGAAATLAFGILSMQQAARAVDYSTLILLFGMMIVASYLRLAGFFELMTEWISRHFHGSRSLLAAVIFSSGVLSAFLVNDVVCVAMTPLVLDLCRRTGKKPIPYLIGLATASNIGSVATITGNPQNIIIGSLSGISYLHFAERLAPVAFVGLLLDYWLLSWIYRKQLRSPAPVLPGPERGGLVHRWLLTKAAIVTLGAVVCFFLGIPIAKVALVAAGVLLLDRVRPEKIYANIDWPLLVMFAGLFVVVAGFEYHVVRFWDLGNWAIIRNAPVPVISALSVALSNLVSNVPAVLLFKPLIATVPNKEQAWLALAMSSTCAGNLTILGSVANLIVVENARKQGSEIRFLEYLKAGIPLTLLTTLIGIGWLSLT